MAQTNFTAADMPGARVAVKPVVAPTPEPAKKASSTPAKSVKKVEAEVETPAAETE